jgi:hypothetical protein
MFRLESDVALVSDWLPSSVFAGEFKTSAEAAATAIEGVDDPEVTEVRVLDATGTAVWRSTDQEYE